MRLALLFGTCLAFDEHNFRQCHSISFCRRYREYEKNGHRAEISAGAYVYNETTTTYHFPLSRTGEVPKALDFELAFYSGGMLRFRIVDAIPVRERYAVPPGLVVRNDLTAVPVTVKSDDATTLFTSPNQVYVQVIHSPFTFRVYSQGKLIQSFNSQGLLSFERHRDQHGSMCSTGISNETVIDAACNPAAVLDDLWEESFNSFEDTKPYGPSAVGIDVTFEGKVSGSYGLPERATSFNLPIDQDIRLFNLDVFKHLTSSAQALYGSIPMITVLHEEQVSGLFWLNPSDTFVRLSRNLSPGESAEALQSTWVSESGIIDAFVFPGPTPASVLRDYHRVTGLAAMPPLFALGAHQCRWNYWTQAEVHDINAGFDKFDIPMDVMWLDIEHTRGKRYFTWNSETFPDPVAMQENLALAGRKLVTIVDPHIKIDDGYDIYTTLKKAGALVKTSSRGDFEGECWPGHSVYPDFLDARVRQLWSSFFAFDKYSGSTTSNFIWNDMNEPSVFSGPELTLPLDAIHLNGFEHRDVHNLYGMSYHLSTFGGLLSRSQGKQRPFILTRSFFAGSHRYGAVWTGDNTADWKFLRVSVPMLLSLSICGFSFAGADVGGFFGNPAKELFIRWHQFGAMAYPFYRSHAHEESAYREPWVYDEEALRLVRDAVITRYQLLPLWYTLFAMHAFDAAPLLRPMWFDFFADREARNSPEDQVMIGNVLLVKAVHQPLEEAKHVAVYLPAGVGWFDLWTSAQFPGGQTITVPLTIDSLPVYVKAGSIIPIKLRVRQSTAKMENDPMTLRVYINSDTQSATGAVYFDDGKSMDYLMSTNASYVKLDYSTGKLALTVSVNNFAGPLLERVDLFGVVGKISNVRVVTKSGEKSLQASQDVEGGVWAIKKPDVSMTEHDWQILFDTGPASWLD